jgi:hypothetical protein
MYPLQFKESVELRTTQAINEILYAAQVVYARFGVACCVTSGRDGEHDPHSKHYTNNALDLRIRDFKPDDLQAVVKGLQELLGQHFFVLLENTHIHVQKGLKG